MINRITENMKFSMITNNMFSLQDQAAVLMEQLSTQKTINRPSDDPAGTNNILNYRSVLASIDQYKSNITSAKTWLSITDKTLDSIKSIVAQAKNLASNTGASADIMDSSAAILSSLIDNVLSLMNTKQGDSYLFGGSKTNSKPFSASPVGSIGDATAAPVNNFDGTVTSGGTYTGTVNKTYAVKIINGGTATNLSDATYQVSTNGGTTWSATQTNLSGPISFGDGLGVTMTFAPTAGDHTLSADDSFTVRATAATIGTATATTVPANTYGGTVTSGGTYTGTTNKTYLVKIVAGGALGAATYHMSTDNGANWGTTYTIGAGGTITLGDGSDVTNGATMTFTADTFAVNDSFTVNASAAITGNATAVPVNTFDGTVATSGTYTGMINKTYALKIIAGGALADASYQISSDNGATWGATQTGLASQITLGDGIKMTFTAGTKNLVADDSFTVRAIATGIGTASAATANAFNGTIASGGTYTGTENKTYALKIIAGGTLAVSTYKISADGGKTWGSAQNFPAREVKGSTANTAGGSPITATTAWNAITGANVQNGTTIAISGLQRDGVTTVGPATFTIANAATGTVQDLLTQIQTTFGSTVTASIDTAGKITVTDKTTGESQIAMTLNTTNPAGGSLGFGAIAATTTKTITLGDGVTTTLTPNTVNLAANDLFTVNAYAAGFYRGNADNLTMQIGKDNNFAYNISGAVAFTAANGPVATASLTTGTGTALTENDTIMLTRGATAGSWTLTDKVNYPDMVITSQNASTVTIDVDGTGTDIIRLSLSGEWSAGNTAAFSITGGTTGTVGSAVTVHGLGAVDLLTTLNALKLALEDHDAAAVYAQVNDLNYIQTKVLQKQTAAGSKSGSLDLTSTNITAFNEQITSMKSGIEDVDLAKIITSYQMQQVAMQASYSMAAQIGKMTILDFLG